MGRGSGRCLCGAVSFRVERFARQVIDCHCDSCRRITGHHMAATAAATDDLDIEGSEAIRWHESTPGAWYGFCATCGSTLFWRADAAPTQTSIAAGTLDRPTGLTTEAIWYADHASDYHVLPTGLETYPTEPGR